MIRSVPYRAYPLRSAYCCIFFKGVFCSFYTFFQLIWCGKSQKIQYDGWPIYVSYTGRFLSNRKSLRRNSTNRSVRIGQASFTEPNRIGQAGLFPNGAERSGLGKCRKRRNAESTERRRKPQKGQKAQKGAERDFLGQSGPKNRRKSRRLNLWLIGPVRSGPGLQRKLYIINKL
jgi:hypothetical protein